MEVKGLRLLNVTIGIKQHALGERKSLFGMLDKLKRGVRVDLLIVIHKDRYNYILGGVYSLVICTPIMISSGVTAPWSEGLIWRPISPVPGSVATD